MSRSPSDIKNFSEVLRQIAGEKNWTVRFKRGRLWQMWEQVAGKQVSMNSWPLRFQEKDTLVVAVTDSIWMHQLSFQKMDLIKAANKLLDDNAEIKDIRFVLADVKKLRSQWIKMNDFEDVPVAASKEEQKAAEELVKGINDAELRKAFKGLYLKNRKRKR